MKLLIAVLLFASAAFAQDNSGTITVYRYKAHGGSWSKANIFVDGEKAATLSNGSTATITLVAGKHTITGPKKNRGSEIVVEADKVYFFRVEAVPFVGFELGAVPQEQASFEMSQLK